MMLEGFYVNSKKVSHHETELISIAFSLPILFTE
jgi:hypothetical protein